MEKSSQKSNMPWIIGAIVVIVAVVFTLLVYSNRSPLKASLPSKPLLAPTGLTCQVPEITLSWNVVPGAMSYRLDRWNSAGIKEAEWSAVSPAFDANAMPATGYTYHVKARNSSVDSAWSPGVECARLGDAGGPDLPSPDTGNIAN